MLEFVNNILSRFRSCFSRSAAFNWFVTIVIGFMVRSDSLGITSIIRDLALQPCLYHSLDHFFRADSWEWAALFAKWCEIVAHIAPLQYVSEYVLLIGDGVKRASDGRFMPATKKMVQESEDSSKPTFIHGHFFGALGILVGSSSKSFCLPLSIRLHDGIKWIRRWRGEEHVSHVVQMFRDGCRAVNYFGKSLLVLDRYFLTVPLLMEWKAYAGNYPDLLHIVTRAKKNCTAYERPGAYKGRGRKPVRGESIHLSDLFETAAASFQTATIAIYGEKKEVRFLSKVYLWGSKWYQPLQFVLVEYDKKQSILVSTSLTLSPEDIIKAYGHRFSIEALFRELKQQLGGFCYHFWTKAVPKLDRYRRKGSSDPLEQITDTKQQKRILEAIKATEGYVMLCSIAIGILQLLCLRYEGKLQVSAFRYLRTPSREVMSEASMMEYLRKTLFRFMVQQKNLTVTKIILSKQMSLEDGEIDLLIS